MTLAAKKTGGEPFFPVPHYTSTRSDRPDASGRCYMREVLPMAKEKATGCFMKIKLSVTRVNGKMIREKAVV